MTMSFMAWTREKAGIGATLNGCRALASKIGNELRNKRPEHFVDKSSLADVHASLERAADVLSTVKGSQGRGTLPLPPHPRSRARARSAVHKGVPFASAAQEKGPAEAGTYAQVARVSAEEGLPQQSNSGRAGARPDGPRRKRRRRTFEQLDTTNQCRWPVGWPTREIKRSCSTPSF